MSVYSREKCILLVFIEFDWLKLDYLICNQLFEIINDVLMLNNEKSDFIYLFIFLSFNF